MNYNDQLYELRSTPGKFTNLIPSQETMRRVFRRIFQVFLPVLSPGTALWQVQTYLP